MPNSKKTTVTCKKCGYKNHVNLGELAAKRRWANTDQKTKNAHIAKMNKARLEKKLSTG